MARHADDVLVFPDHRGFKPADGHIAIRTSFSSLCHTSFHLSCCVAHIKLYISLVPVNGIVSFLNLKFRGTPPPATY
jgi:hypothetical protein